VAYTHALRSFRGMLQGYGLDLVSQPREVALMAQAWASRRVDGRDDVAPTTFNQRLAILSSFYAFGIRRGLLVGENPTSR
jgi:hypothetical protein